MKVKRIVANIKADDLEVAKAFYGDLFELEVVMDLDWIITFASSASMTPQINITSTRHSGAPTPDISIEVDDLDEIYERVCTAGIALEYGPVAEPWGVKRFFIRDPFGRLLNILAHIPQAGASST